MSQLKKSLTNFHFYMKVNIFAVQLYFRKIVSFQQLTVLTGQLIKLVLFFNQLINFKNTSCNVKCSGPPSSLSIRAGSTYRDRGGQIYQVLTFYQHPLYHVWSIDYDVSVLFVETIQLGLGAQPIPLLKKNEQVEVGALATLSGWGTLEPGGLFPVILQRVEVPKVNDSYCYSRYGKLTPRMTCYGYEKGGKDSCQVNIFERTLKSNLLKTNF